MKKGIISVLLAVGMVFALLPAAVWAVGEPFLNNGGDGAEDSPYEINDLEQLEAFRDYINADDDGGSGEYFKLTANIDMTDKYGAGGTSWTPEQPQEGIILRKLDEIDKMPDKLEAALEMFCFVVRSQMFTDGNKRVAQLMCNKIMMENDIGILSVPYEKIDTFKGLLVEFYESNDSTDIKAFFRKDCLLLNPGYKQENVL